MLADQETKEAHTAPAENTPADNVQVQKLFHKVSNVPSENSVANIQYLKQDIVVVDIQAEKKALLREFKLTVMKDITKAIRKWQSLRSKTLSDMLSYLDSQIGRASCRERVYVLV